MDRDSSSLGRLLRDVENAPADLNEQVMVTLAADELPWRAIAIRGADGAVEVHCDTEDEALNAALALVIALGVDRWVELTGHVATVHPSRPLWLYAADIAGDDCAG